MGEVHLTYAQNEAVREIRHHLQLIACAGSGKTEVLTRRIVHIMQMDKDVVPEQIVAFTFTEKAAESLKRRIGRALEEAGCGASAAEGMYIGTIHGFCSRILRSYCSKFQDFKILDTVKNHLFVQRYAVSCGMLDLGLASGMHDIQLFLECIAKMVDDYDFQMLWEEKHRLAFEKYRSCLYEHKYLDFSLLIMETLDQIWQNTELKEYLGNLRYLIVDEYQDVDDLQEKLIRKIADMGANLCVVGDDDQTIYQFRGSNSENIIGFSDRYNDVRQIRMEDNFRCAKEIVDIADCVIRCNERRLEKRMCSATTISGEAEGFGFENDEQQYEYIASQIKELHNYGTPYSEIAVLLRKGKYINSVCDALSRHGIPFATNSADHFFKGEYFQRFVETLSMLADIDKAKIYDCWKSYTDEVSFNKAFRTLRRASRSGGNAQQFPLSGTIRQFAQDAGFLNPQMQDFHIRMDDLEGFSLILDDYDEIYKDWQLSARIDGIMRFLEEQAVEEYKYHNFAQNSAPGDAVQVMTVHKSKGLEFDTVFIPNLMKREFPVGESGGRKYWHILGGRFEEKKDRYASDIEDERKLFYVAVTRAKRKLVLCWETAKKSISEFVHESAQSEFLQIDRLELEREKLRAAEQELQALARKARHALMDYYGTAARSGMKAAYADLNRVQEASDYDVVAEAQKMGLI